MIWIHCACCVCVAMLSRLQSGRHLSALADWGKHFCQAESAPTLSRLLGASKGQGVGGGRHTEPFDKFVETYPFCTEDDGRRLAVGGGTLAAEWQYLVRTVALLPFGGLQCSYYVSLTLLPRTCFFSRVARRNRTAMRTLTTSASLHPSTPTSPALCAASSQATQHQACVSKASW